MRFNLKDFRQSHSLFQSDMAELLNLNQSNISRAEIRGYLELSYPQLNALYNKYGREDVDSFMLPDPVSIGASNNTNEGDGNQDNRVYAYDLASLDLIKKQSEALMKLAEKQNEQTDRLITLLEKISEKL